MVNIGFTEDEEIIQKIIDHHGLWDVKGIGGRRPSVLHPGL